MCRAVGSEFRGTMLGPKGQFLSKTDSGLVCLLTFFSRQISPEKKNRSIHVQKMAHSRNEGVETVSYSEIKPTLQAVWGCRVCGTTGRWTIRHVWIEVIKHSDPFL